MMLHIPLHVYIINYALSLQSLVWSCTLLKILGIVSNPAKVYSLFFMNGAWVAQTVYILGSHAMACSPRYRIRNSWYWAKKTLWIIVFSLLFIIPQALRWLAANTRVTQSLTGPPNTCRVRVEYPTCFTPKHYYLVFKSFSSSLL